MLRQRSIDAFEQLRSGQQIEHGHGIGTLGMSLDTSLLLLRWAQARLHMGWLFG